MKRSKRGSCKRNHITHNKKLCHSLKRSTALLTALLLCFGDMLGAGVSASDYGTGDMQYSLEESGAVTSAEDITVGKLKQTATVSGNDGSSQTEGSGDCEVESKNDSTDGAFDQIGTVTGSNISSQTEGADMAETGQSMGEAAVYCAPSDGSLAGQSLKFVNLYWETDALGSVEAVFDGGSGEPTVQLMQEKERGVYETAIPAGDYSRVTFRRAVTAGENTAGKLEVSGNNADGVQEVSGGNAAGDFGGADHNTAEDYLIYGDTSYNLYGSRNERQNTTGIVFTEIGYNTFYYDMGGNPSYWGCDPEYDAAQLPVTAMYAAGETAEGHVVKVAPKDLVYFVDLAEVEFPEEEDRHNADRMHIAFLKKGHEEPEPDFDPNDGNIDGEVYTMYERRDGVYSAPFPEKVNGEADGEGEYAEIAFQLVKDKGTGEESYELLRHFNFRGDQYNEHNPDGSLKAGHFKYNPEYIDAFFYNNDEDQSFWGLHPSVADNSLDTQVLYIDTTDYNENGLVGAIDDLWISWKGMPEGEEGSFDSVKGYKVTDRLARENVRYFQFPYASAATENTVLTLTYTVKKEDGSIPEEHENKIYQFKFFLVARSSANCLQLDHVWEFNGQMWTTFEVGDITERTVFYQNTKTEYDDIYMLLSKAATGEDGQEAVVYASENELKEELAKIGWTKNQIADRVFEEKVGEGEKEKTYVWLKLAKEAEPNDYDKTNLYSLKIPSSYTHAQFKGVMNSSQQAYYSNREEISTTLSYPCYYASQVGSPLSGWPGDTAEAPGLIGFWRSVYSVDTSGDRSIDIPNADFVREKDVYYGTSVFYDYYSDFEMSGRKRTEVQENIGSTPYSDHADMFNYVASAYYNAELEKQDRTEDERQKFDFMYIAPNNSKTEGDKWEGQWNDYPVNKWTQAGGGPYFEIADQVLTEDGRITMGTVTENGNERYSGIEMPFFNEDFLRGNNSIDTAVGNVYKNVLFPFKKDLEEGSKTHGYWVFDSARESDAMRISYDTDEGYFLQRTGKPVRVRSKNQFYPFTDAEKVNGDGNQAPGGTPSGKINYLFGTQLNIEFKLTDDNIVYNEYTQQSEPIRFEFQGDDDAWIYVDGILALDMGGIHDAVRGEIDFQAGTYTIWRNIAAGNGYEGPGTVDKTGRLPEELLKKLEKKGESHTLTMYYMERGLYESNLKLTFNFPRESTFSVEKEVDVISKLTQSDEPNVFSDLLENMGGFIFDIKNLVTSEGELPVEESAGYLIPGDMKWVYGSDNHRDGLQQDIKFENSEAGTVTNENGIVSVTQTSTVEGARPEEATLLKVDITGEPMDVSDMSYLRLSMVNKGTSDSSARNLYLGFVDSEQRRAGGYANTVGYEGETNTFLLGEESVIRVDYRKMQQDAGFDWSKVDYLLIGIRRTKPKDAAAYDISSIAFFENMNQVEKNGFSVTDEQISDYGSYASGELTPVEGAWYVRKNKREDGTYDAGISRQTDNGGFALADGQKVIFTDKFRTGSYLALSETVDPDIFNSSWTILEDGGDVDGKYLLRERIDVSTVINPYHMIDMETPLKDVKGTQVYDGRKEVISEDWLKGREEKGTAFIDPTDGQNITLVYRSYIAPDQTSNMPTDIRVAVKNTLKYGEITITKKLSDKMKDEATDQFKEGDYLFDIYYTNVAGMGLESQLSPAFGNLRYVKQTVTVHVDSSGEGSVTIPNIPAGTSYHIVERPSNGTKLIGIEIGDCISLDGTTVIKPGEAEMANEDMKAHDKVEIYGVTGEGEGADYSKAYVEGIAYASNQHFIFTNERTPFYMDIEKIWNDGLTNEERAELGITEVYISLQRRLYEGEGSAAEWENVTRDYFENVIVDTDTGYIKLTADDNDKWKTTSTKPLEEEDGGGNPYEYRIQEIDEDGKLKNYEVSYDEIRNPDYTGKDGDTYLHVTYRATNTLAGIMLNKVWDDNGDISGVRPESVRVKLLGSSKYDPNGTDPDNSAAVTWTCYRALQSEEENHQCGDSCYIELEEGSAWKKAVNNLQLKDGEGRSYYYKLAEEQIKDGESWEKVENHINGYEVTYSEPVQPQGGNALTISVTNGLNVGNIKLIKKDSKTEANLQGAKFKLERLIPEQDEEGNDIPDEQLQPDKNFEPRTATTDNLGRLTFSALPYGKYKITETEAPSGYLLLKNPVYINIDEKAFAQQAEQHKDDITYDPDSKTITVTVKNEKGLTIPWTGGKGHTGLTIVGLALCTAAALLYLYKCVRRMRTHYSTKK